MIFPSYDKLKAEGLLGSKPPTKPNFFAARILADEALASKVGRAVFDMPDLRIDPSFVVRAAF